jgi:hypothetical protein
MVGLGTDTMNSVCPECLWVDGRLGVLLLRVGLLGFEGRAD